MLRSTTSWPLALLALLFTSLPCSLALPTPLDGRSAAIAWSDEPFAPVSFIAYFPKITVPLESTVWTEGSSVAISWNGTAPPYDPAQIPQTANITLGYLSDTSAGFHLDVAHPLAVVQLFQEPYSVNVTLPTNLTTRSTYILILGSSANSSPQFRIEGTGPSDDAPTSTSSSSTGRQIEARPTTYVVGGVTTVLGAAASATSAEASFSEGGAASSSSPSDSTGSTPGPSTTPTDGSSSPSAEATAAPSSTSVALASQEETVTVTASSASSTPTSAAGSLKGSQWVVLAVGAALGGLLL